MIVVVDPMAASKLCEQAQSEAKLAEARYQHLAAEAVAASRRAAAARIEWDRADQLASALAIWIEARARTACLREGGQS